MCCKIPGIPETQSPPGQWCRHVDHGRGCAIHDARPDSCRAYFCHYMRNPHLGPDWRPDRAKFILTIEAGGRRMIVGADPAAPAAWRRPPYYAQFKRWALAGAAQNHQILVFNGKRATAVLPDRDLDLGIVEVGDEVIYHARQGAIDVELRRRPN